jgi:SRSO17 transposase
VLAYLRGLLGQLERKNGWTLAEAAGEVSPDDMQRLLRTADWDADAVRDELRGYVVERLGSGGVLIVDETGFIKKGTRSAGVARQYTGTTGKIDNCQIGVFCAYATPAGRALIDRELYLPRLDRGPGAGPLRRHRRRCRVRDQAAAGPPDAHPSRPDPGAGLLRLRWTRGAALEQLVGVAGARWAIEECFQAAKSEAGLASYQVRDYTAWYRHVTLAMLAHAYLSATRATAEKGGPEPGTTSSSS